MNPHTWPYLNVTADPVNYEQCNSSVGRNLQILGLTL